VGMTPLPVEISFNIINVSFSIGYKF